MTACQNTPKTPALDMANFDLSVAPNADFYEYATGGWQKNNPLKPEYARYGSFDILRDNNEKRINELFSGMTRDKKNRRGTIRFVVLTAPGETSRLEGPSEDQLREAYAALAAAGRPAAEESAR